MHPVGAVDALGDRLDLVADRHRRRVQRPVLARAARSPRRPPRPARPRPFPPLAGPSLISAAKAPASRASLRTSSHSSSVSVGKRLIATTHGRPKAATLSRWRLRLAIPFSIACRPCGPRDVGVVGAVAAVVLERAHGRHHHAGVRPEIAGRADDVHELLHPQVRAEPRLGDDVVAELERDAVGQHRVVAVGDVGERTGVHEHRLALERLHQVGLDRVAHQHGHRAGRPEIVGGDRLAAERRDRR